MDSDLEVVLNDFLDTLKEVDILLLAAEANVLEEVTYAAYNKSALLLLSGKFENFVESIAEQYVFVVNKLKLPSSIIPDIVRVHHSLGAINKVEIYKSAGRYDEIKKIFSEISSIWATNVEFGDLKIECKFTYGKHGENELRRLFVPLGISDVYAQVEVYIPDENITDAVTLKKVDFKGIFNSVIGMRNSILHQNASPGLTHGGVREYKSVFENFSKELTLVLDANVSALNVAHINSM